MLEKKCKVRIVRAYNNILEGQQGRIVAFSGENALVDLDGYDYERQLAESFKKERGESPNEVPYLVTIPKYLLQTVN